MDPNMDPRIPETQYYYRRDRAPNGNFVPAPYEQQPRRVSSHQVPAHAHHYGYPAALDFEALPPRRVNISTEITSTGSHVQEAEQKFDDRARNWADHFTAQTKKNEDVENDLDASNAATTEATCGLDIHDHGLEIHRIRLDGVDSRLKTQDTCLRGVEQRLGSHAGRLIVLEREDKVRELEKTVADMEKKMNVVKKESECLKTKMEEMKKAMQRQIDQILGQIGTLNGEADDQISRRA